MFQSRCVNHTHLQGPLKKKQKEEEGRENMKKNK